MTPLTNDTTTPPHDESTQFVTLNSLTTYIVQHRENMLNSLKRFTGEKDVGTLEDAFQDACLGIVMRVFDTSQTKLPISRLNPFFHASLKNAYITQVRQKRKIPKTLENTLPLYAVPSTLPSPIDVLAMKELIPLVREITTEVITKANSMIAEVYRREKKGEDYLTIATSMQLARGTVSTYLRRIREEIATTILLRFNNLGIRDLPPHTFSILTDLPENLCANLMQPISP